MKRLRSASLAGESSFVVVGEALLDRSGEGAGVDRLEAGTAGPVLVDVGAAVGVEAAVAHGVIREGFTRAIGGVRGAHIGQAVERVVSVAAGVAEAGPEEARGLG